jgi:hypothetical protein
MATSEQQTAASDGQPDVLRTPQLAEALGLSDHTVRRLGRDYGLAEGGGGESRDAYHWPLPAIHRMQVAAALETVITDLTRGHGRHRSTFSALLEAVVANREAPTAPTWAIYREGAVSYAWYPADVSRLVGSGAVVAKIEALWPERRTP